MYRYTSLVVRYYGSIYSLSIPYRTAVQQLYSNTGTAVGGAWVVAGGRVCASCWGDFSAPYSCPSTSCSSSSVITWSAAGRVRSGRSLAGCFLAMPPISSEDGHQGTVGRIQPWHIMK
eukprot:COSAG01_NODE_382_length_17840_cov_68.658663_16_plen_118_part_00